MKNIHILPTDSPSRLYTYKSIDLYLHPTIVDAKASKFNCINQNIYITSDEEIKEGDCVFNLKSKQVYFITIVEEIVDYEKKIILTTDQDLIKDGVQSINDEFLEWFINNQNCEEVVVKPYCKKLTCKNDSCNICCQELKYKIIIPKEEPKREFVGNTSKWNMEDFEEPKQDLEKEIFELEQELGIPSHLRWHNSKPKQETLEEVAIQKRNELGLKGTIDGFIAGAKWMQERSYSEEDLLHFYNFIKEKCDTVNTSGYAETHVKWFIKQFKKK